MMKRAALVIVILALSVVSMAQVQPKWISNLPSARSNTFEYIRAHGRGKDYSDAKKDALQDLRRKILESHGDATEVVEINEETFYKTMEGQQYKLQKREVCEWTSNSSREIWYLYQVQRNANITPRFDEFNDCYPSRFRFWHPIIPGLGEIKKGYNGTGVLFITLQAASLGGAGYCYLKEQEQYKIMKSPEVGLSDYLKAKENYEMWNQNRNIMFGVAAGVYAVNLIVAYALPEKQARYLSFYPEIIPANGDLAVGATITYQF